jgi:phage tail-like protein
MTYVLSSRQSQEAVLPQAGRVHVDGLTTPCPIVAQLPSALQEDEFCTQLVGAFDELMAPIFSTLDCLDTYLDPHLAPDDFVEWLASWVGIDIDETWTIEKRRILIENAVVLYRIRGTAPGLAAHLWLYAGATPEIEESGGCIWSQTADNAFPGSATPSLTVRVRVDDDANLRLSTLNRIVADSRPAHVPYLVELTVGGQSTQSSDDEPAAGDEAGGVAADAPGAVSLPGSEHIELALLAPTTDEEIESSPEEPPEGSGPGTA